MRSELLSILLSIGILLCLSPVKAPAETLTIGRVSENPAKHYKELKPLLDYVVSHLKDVGITDGQVVMAPDKEGMIKLLKEKKVDWITHSVFPALKYAQETGAEIALRSWREGVPTYYAVIFARKDSGINSLHDAKGKKIAFEHSGSTSAYFVPAAILRKDGFELVELSSPREKAPPGKIGYVFAGDELNITTWVHRGLTDLGAYHNQNWEDAQQNPNGMRKDLKAIYRGKPLPRMVEVVRKDLDPRVKARLIEVLLKANQDPAAQEALQAYAHTTKFDEFKGDAKIGLEEVKQLMQFVGGDVP